MEVALIMLVILMVLTIIFIPVYAIFYKLTNYSDEHPWAKKMMKGWLIVASTLGISFTFFLLIFLAVNMITSGICFYSKELITNTNFVSNYKNDLDLSNEKISQIIGNCFDKEKSTFASYFNLNGKINTDGNNTTQEDIRTKPKTSGL